MKLRSGKTYGPPKARKGKVVKVTKKIRVRPMKMTQQAQVSTLVKRMISRDVENKGIGENIEVNVYHNSPIGPADCLPLVPQIAQLDAAVADTCVQRVGDKVKPKSLTVRGTITARYGSFPANQCVYVRVIIAAQKTIKVGSQILAGGVLTNQLCRPMFASGPGLSEVPFGGNTTDLNYPLNKDLFRVYYDRTFKLAPTNQQAIAVEQNDKNTIRWSYRFKSLPASLTFDSANGDWANNFAPFYTMGYAYADGTAPDIANSRIVTNTTTLLEFEDA